MKKKEHFTYKSAGVDIEAGNQLVKRIKNIVSSTKRSGALGSIGGFGGLFELDIKKYPNPVLVSGTDGVGTKVKLAIQSGIHNKIGIDLVAMCVNDVIAQGAEPLFFLDYLSTNKLNIDIASQIIEGIAEGCKLAGASLIGGETAEHPDEKNEGSLEYDLAGFCVGVCNKDDLIDGSNIIEDDIIIGISSSGPHSNGYSLIRKLLEKNESSINKKIIEDLLVPTKIYSGIISKLVSKFKIKGIAHITGGGLTENIPRALPRKLGASLNKSSWEEPDIFQWIRSHGVSQDEMYRTFNCGIGMIIIIDKNDKKQILSLIGSDEKAWEIGKVIKDKSQKVSII
ncbi:MAG: phosphoribosylformylglycinamidine cyclo-ligase [Pseudomonadota bacterium]|nr:phosphoribosylformylglycinamidine cyclo-ligase [Pseudomonadota bacterium]|tara:strand:+ start:2824 stop:3843 length:1020 start_codon:yes stop_codon:yes gene_type:complete